MCFNFLKLALWRNGRRSRLKICKLRVQVPLKPDLYKNCDFVAEMVNAID